MKYIVQLAITIIMLGIGWSLGLFIDVSNGHYMFMSAISGSFVTGIIIIRYFSNAMNQAGIEIVKDKESKKWRAIQK